MKKHHQCELVMADNGVGGKVTQIPNLPSILKMKDGVLNMVTDGGLKKGDTYNVFPSRDLFEVSEVLENRPAKGDWSGSSYVGKKPMFSRVKSLKIEWSKTEN